MSVAKTMSLWHAATATHEPAPLWTALYQKFPRCWNVEIGQADGPLISQELAHKLALKYSKDTRMPLCLVVPGSRKEWRL